MIHFYYQSNRLIKGLLIIKKERGKKRLNLVVKINELELFFFIEDAFEIERLYKIELTHYFLHSLLMNRKLDQIIIQKILL